MHGLGFVCLNFSRISLLVVSMDRTLKGASFNSAKRNQGDPDEKDNFLK